MKDFLKLVEILGGLGGIGLAALGLIMMVRGHGSGPGIMWMGAILFGVAMLVKILRRVFLPD